MERALMQGDMILFTAGLSGEHNTGCLGGTSIIRDWLSEKYKAEMTRSLEFFYLTKFLVLKTKLIRITQAGFHLSHFLHIYP